MDSFHSLDISEELKKCRVTRFEKENNVNFLLEHNGRSVVLFKIQGNGSLFDTLEDLRVKSRGRIDSDTVQAIILVLSKERYYQDALRNSKAIEPDVQDTPDIVVTDPSVPEPNIINETPEVIDLLIDLDPHIVDRDYAEYVIRTAKKTVKQEDGLVRQIVYVGLSKDSDNPLNLAVLAPTSEGKTHAVLQTLQYFPKQDLWKIGSMSPKVIIRQSGVLVDSNNEPLEGKIKKLRKQIKLAQKNKDDNQEEELQEQIRHLYQEAKVMIELAGKLLVFLEPPHPDTWSILKPILSHDDFEIEHPYVYEVEGMGFKVKKVITRGWPACIFCSAKNESKWPVWPEIQSRFLITSPNMGSQKYLEGNVLTAQKMGLPKLIQQSLIISDKEIELAKKCVIYLVQKMKDFTNGNGTNSDPVWIPYSQILANVLPAEKGTDNRITKRIFSFLRITLSRSHLRGRLQYGPENLVIANLEEDLHEVLHITQNVSGIPPYKLKLFKEVFLEKFKAKKEPDKSKDGTKEERIAAVTTRELCEYYKEKTGKTISTNNLRQNYLNEFINNGLIDEEDSFIDSRQKIYRPIVDLPDNEHTPNEYDQKISFLSISDRMDNILQHPCLQVPKRFKYIPENWLELEILDLLKYPSIIERFELYNQENERLCICRFVKLYQKAQMIIGYFSNAIFYNTSNDIFGSLQKLDHFDTEICKKLSIEAKMDNKDIFERRDKEIELRAVRSNVVYAQVIRNNHLLQGYADCSTDNTKEKITAIDNSSLTQSVEDFFYDDPALPWTPLSEHSLQESPCYPIIDRKGEFYSCRIHQVVQSTYLENIEHHCKYKEPKCHKAEIIRLLQEKDINNGSSNN